MRIPRELIKYYFDYAVSDYLDDFQDFPSEIDELDEYMPNLKAILMNNHEQISLAVGLEELLKDSNIDLQRFYGYDFPLENEEIRTVMNYLLRVVSPEDPPNIETTIITEESIEDYRIKNGLLHKVEPKQTLRDIAEKFGLTLDFIKAANPYWYDTLGYSKPIDVGRTVRLKLASNWQ